MDFSVFKRHNKRNTSCRFPMSRCICTEERGYERLESCPYEKALEEYEAGEDKDSYSNEKEEELLFYNDDSSHQRLLVERNLCTLELCQLLVVKNRVVPSLHWSIVEFWMEMGLERVLEDHEHVLNCHWDMTTFVKPKNFRFVFRKEFRKYEFFNEPQNYFPPELFEAETYQQIEDETGFWKNFLNEDSAPTLRIYSSVWIRDYNLSWSKLFLVIVDTCLYYSSNVTTITKYLKATRSSKSKTRKQFPEQHGLTQFCDLSRHYIYITLNAKNQFRAPTEWGLVLRPACFPESNAAAGTTSQDAAGDPAGSGANPHSSQELRCFACDSEQVRSCWLTAMRLAKYGKQLKENYRAFKNKQNEQINHSEYNSFTVPHESESVRSRVAMDFTGPVGRIVDDPQEARAIAVAEGFSWKRRWRPAVRSHNGNAPATETGVHTLQPWFHSGMSRDQASELVNRHGTDGVFLVRESRSSPGAFVLTCKALGKILHMPITPLMDPVREAHVYSMDSGVTKFYDLLQLVEFYQLNAGCLPTRLTHYVQHTADETGNRLAPAI